MTNETSFNKCPTCGRLVINNYCTHPTTDTENKENK